MFSLRAFLFLALSVVVVSAHPHPHENSPPMHFRRQEEGSTGGAFSASRFPAVQEALAGNERFRQTRNETAIRALVADGQKPPFMMISCSDSRAPEATIFDSQPGTFFMERNIANQYKPGDENAQSVMAYGVRVLGVQHVVVMGHYGCGGIAAAIASRPTAGIDVATHIVQTWIGDIRALYLSSNRSEIVEMRTRNLEREAAGETVEEPDVQDPGFRALVEENVKQQVKRISESSVMENLNEEVITKLNTDGTPRSGSAGEERKRAEEEGTLIPVFVHGWVHDIETGEVTDLNISTGPAGFENFTPPAEGANPEEPAATSSEEAAATSTTEGAAESTTTAEGAAETPSAETSSAAEGSSSAEAEPSSTAAAEAEPTTAPTPQNVAAPAAPGDVRVHGPGSRPATGTPARKRSQTRRMSFAQRRDLAQQAK